jgi:hypothetical protein
MGLTLILSGDWLNFEWLNGEWWLILYRLHLSECQPKLARRSFGVMVASPMIWQIFSLSA